MGRFQKWGIGVACCGFLAIVTITCCFAAGERALEAMTLEVLQTVPAQLGGQAFQLEVAATPEQHTRGLMYRDHLDPDRGMLFTFPILQSVSFWMKNCKIPLDMVFLRDDRIVHIVHSAPPCEKAPCPTYPSVYPINRVIELPGGTANHLSLHPGDPVNFLPNPKP